MAKFNLNDVFSAAGAVSGLFSGIGANKRMKKQQQFQAEQHQKDLDFQKSMYERSVQVNRQNLADERAYNNPQAIMQRLKEAGINPDMYYGQGTGLVDGNVADGGSMPSASTPNYMYTPVQPVQSMLQGSQIALNMAQSRKIEAETEKEQGLSQSVDLDNAIKSATAGNTIEMASMNVRLSKSFLSLNEAQKDRVLQDINNMKTQNEQINATIQNLKASTAKMSNEAFKVKADVFFRSKEFDLAAKRLENDIKESGSRIKLNLSQAKEVLELLISKKLALSNQATLNASAAAVNFVRRSNLIIEGRQADFNLQYDKDNKAVIDAVNSASTLLNTLNGTINAFAHTIDAVVPY